MVRLADKLDQLGRDLDAAQGRLAELAADIGKATRRRHLLRFWK
jgi:hypothetical protein